MLASLACAPRRLACRYWAGRVALRENRARQHLPAGPRGSEAARPKINLLKSQAALSVAAFARRAPRPRRVPRFRDSTLVAWYRSLSDPDGDESTHEFRNWECLGHWAA